MKAIYTTLIMLFFTGSLLAQNVGINTDGSSPNSKAMLDVKSTTKGFLPPRMTYAQRNAISSPPAGLMVWCSDCQPSGELQVYSDNGWTNMTGGSASVPLIIGQNYQGGRIFYLDATGLHGLITATVDQSTGIQWALLANQTNFVPGGTLTTIGSGAANTDKIIAQNGAGTTYAAGLARAYNGGGYNDWFLPSKDELYQMYLKRNVTVGNYGSNSYWSSSEYGAPTGWSTYFGSGGSDGYGKESNRYVRAIRAF